MHITAEYHQFWDMKLPIFRLLADSTTARPATIDN